VGNPVVAVVNGFVAGGGIGLCSIHSVHDAAEVVTSNDAVDVGACNSRLDDGIGPLHGERRAVDSKGVTIEACN